MGPPTTNSSTGTRLTHTHLCHHAHTQTRNSGTAYTHTRHVRTRANTHARIWMTINIYNFTIHTCISKYNYDVQNTTNLYMATPILQIYHVQNNITMHSYNNITIIYLLKRNHHCTLEISLKHWGKSTSSAPPLAQ